MDDGYCVECGDEFHDDDVGGYNPACRKCGLCRSCCRLSDFGCVSEHEDDDSYLDEDDGFDDEGFPAAPRAGDAREARDA